MIKNIKEYNDTIIVNQNLPFIIDIASYGKRVKMQIDLHSEVSNSIHYQWQIGEELSSGGLSWSNIGNNKNYLELIAQQADVDNKYYRVLCSNGCHEIISNTLQIKKIETPLPPTNVLFEGVESIDELLPVGSILGEFSTVSNQIYSYDHTYEIISGTVGFENFEIDGNKLRIKKRIFFKDAELVIFTIKSTNDYGLSATAEFSISINNTNVMNVNNLIKNADFQTENYGFSARVTKRNNISNIQDWEIDRFVNLYNGFFSDFDWLDQRPLGAYPHNKEDIFLQILNIPKDVNKAQHKKNRIYQHLILQSNTQYVLSFDLAINANMSDTILGDGIGIIVQNDSNEKILDTSVYYTDFNRVTRVTLNFTTGESTDYTINFFPLECSKQTGPLIGKLNLVEEEKYQE